MLYLILSALSFGCGFGLLNYADNQPLPAEKESVMMGAGVSVLSVGIILCAYGIACMVVK